MTATGPPERQEPSERHGPRGQRIEPDFLLELFSNPLDPGYADAAARRAEHGSRVGWRRNGALALRIATLVVVGFLLAVAWREAVAAEPERTRAHAGLVAEVKTAQRRSDDLQARTDTLRTQVRAQEQAALGGTAADLARVKEQEAAAGLAPVTGSGIVVRLIDAPAPIDPTTGRPSGADVSRVLDVDLQAVVNGLWAAGAEAISVNGQRLTSTSTIRTAGSAVLVDFRPVTSPYEVSAIGPSDLADRFDRSVVAATMRDLVNQYGLGFSTREERDLRLAAAPGRDLRYANPVGLAPSKGVR